MSFLEKLEQAENKLDKKVKSWIQEREKAIKNIKPQHVIDEDRGDELRQLRKDQRQWEMYKDSYYSGY